MSKKISVASFIVVLIAVIVATFMLTYSVTSYKYEELLADAEINNNGGDIQDDSTIGSDMYTKIKFIDRMFTNYAYYDWDEEAIFDAMMKGYADGTGDKYAEYYTEEEFDAMTADNTGEMQGIGVNVIFNEKYEIIEIINVMKDSPALEAGLQTGDLIVYVGTGDNKESVAALGYYQAVAKIQGLKGTYAEISVVRDEDFNNPIDFKIERKTIKTESVMYRVSEYDNTVGVIKILEFDLTTPQQFSEAVDALKAQGITKFVFDVRNNPGGDLESITAVLSYFLNKGDIVIRTETKNGTFTQTTVDVLTHNNENYAKCDVSKDDIAKYRDLDFVVLCNENTASAAELFTSALKDYNLGKIVGTVTYGKGSMQSIFDLSQVSTSLKGGIKMTTRLYYPPLSDNYNGIGITPDVEIEMSEESKNINLFKITDAQDDQLKKAIDTLNTK